MKVLIYLSFTLLSIFIQFCIMDILERTKNNDTSQEKNVLKDILEESHALFYKIDENMSLKNETPKYNNASLPPDPFLDKYFSSSTPVYDMLFEDNSTISESVDTTEVYSTTEFANETELDLFPKVSTTPKPKSNPKKIEYGDNCFCDLTYNSCDLNCCCDGDCSSSDQQLFSTCLQNNWSSQTNVCSQNIDILSINGLLCTSKSNIPAKHNAVSYSKDNIDVEKVKLKMFTWSDKVQNDNVINFLGKIYTQDEPVWMLYENSPTLIDLPIPYVNNFCSRRKPMKYLRDESYQCLVKLKSLESLRIYRYINSTQIISVPTDVWDTETLNCTTLLCTKWNIQICDQETCENLNQTKHEPACNDNYCTNIALKIEYIFNCNASNITNAIIRLHTQNIELKNQYFNQEISVKYFLGAQNFTDHLILFSGNPGYIENLPVIASYDKENHTEGILSKNKTNLAIIRYPNNIKGECILTNTTYKVIKFRENIRNKCSYKYNKQDKNATVVCKNIQTGVYRILDANRNKFISPSGNPLKLSDKDWIEVKQEILSSGIVFGEYDLDNSTLICNNLVTKLSYVFTFADTGEDESYYKILDAKCYLKSESKVRMRVESISPVLTVDVSFLDVTKQPVFEYAGAPNLNIRLPEDFFYPFYQNQGNTCRICLLMWVFVCFVVRNKINIS